MLGNFRQLLVGRPRDLKDPQIFHSISLVALLAWVGLGADGLSSSAYGPEQAFLALGSHGYMAVYLAVMMAATVFIISFAYSHIIELFPNGGGGYLVATKLLGERAGLVAGCALLVDYIFTITISIAAGMEAIWSLLPPHFVAWKLPLEILVLALLVLLNLRGVKESIQILAPIFFVFLITHAVLIAGGLWEGATRVPELHRQVVSGTTADLKSMGLFAFLALFFRAYSLGGGTYTGIEAVSNGLPMMREPRVATGKATMGYLAISLAFTASGVMLCYLLLHVQPEPGKTMNAVLAETFVKGLHLDFPWLSQGFVILVLLSEAFLLFVAAESGFLAGPRIMANMAVDSWFPHRFAALSERLTMENGVILLGGFGLFTLLYTGGRVEILVVMYSINVFLTFSLSLLGMVRHWWQARKIQRHWRRELILQCIAFLLCAGILVVTVLEKFREGAWMTLLITSSFVAACGLVRRHYRKVKSHVGKLDESLSGIPLHEKKELRELRRELPTAVLLVSGYNGLGIHSLLSLLRLFPKHFANVVFVSVGVLDSANFKGADETGALEADLTKALDRYVDFTQRLGAEVAVTSRHAIGTEAVEEAERLCWEVSREFPRSIVFASKLIFQRENLLQRLLHNETGYAIQRRLQFSGLQTVVLPIRVMT